VYWKSFVVLSASRVITQAGPCGIPLSEILAWCDMRGVVDREAREDYVFLVGQLDAEFLSYHSERMMQQHEKGKADIAKAKAQPRR